MDINQKGEILIYQTEKGETKIDVYMEDSTIWLNQASIAQLYQTTPQNITKHIKKIYAEDELAENRTCNYYSQVQSEGGRTIKRKMKFYNLDIMFLDHAEDMARGKTPMTMRDWDNSLNEFLQFRRREILEGKGKVSREDMERKILQEYAIYNSRRLNTPSEDEIISELPTMEE